MSFLDGGEHAIAKQSASTTDDADIWLLEPAPYGQGWCLVSAQSADFVEILAPPGVMLEQPEQISRLLSWRLARWSRGRLLKPPALLSLTDALDLAPSRQTWIIAAVRELELSDRALQDTETGVVSLRELFQHRAPDPRLGEFDPAAIGETSHTSPSELEHTGSATSFAKHVRQSGPNSTIWIVRDAVDNASDITELKRTLDARRRRVGHPEVQDALIALLHGRARSHSWRYTRWFGRPYDDPALRRLTQVVDSDLPIEQLKAMVDAMRKEGLRLDGLLEVICFERANSRRWTRTKPARLLGFSRPARPVRDRLRDLQRISHRILPRRLGAPQH
jgi:hypothetical protein